MGWLQTIGGVIKALMFFLELWAEKDKKKAEEKKEIADKITDAFKQTDPKKRASELNIALDSVKRLRK